MPVEDEINDYHNNYSVIVEKPVCIKYFFVLRVMAFYAKSFWDVTVDISDDILYTTYDLFQF